MTNLSSQPAANAQTPSTMDLVNKNLAKRYRAEKTL